MAFDSTPVRTDRHLVAIGVEGYQEGLIRLQVASRHILDDETSSTTAYLSYDEIVALRDALTELLDA